MSVEMVILYLHKNAFLKFQTDLWFLPSLLGKLIKIIFKFIFLKKYAHEFDNLAINNGTNFTKQINANLPNVKDSINQW